MQWLQIKRIEFISPDGQLFPTFNDKLRASMLRETELFVESIIREDRSILDMLDANYTFLNEPLAKHYGIADTVGNVVGQKPAKSGGRPILGEQFRRVTLQDRSRGGLLTQASVLTVTSNPTRTSPVKRGKWILEQILGAPPPSPPPNVPELPEKEKDVAAASLRQRMEVHRRNPGLRQLPRPDGCDRLRTGKLQRRRRSFAPRMDRLPSTRPANSRTARSSPGRWN